MVPPVFANTDTRIQRAYSKNRTKLASIIMGFGVKEGKKEKSGRASFDDLKRFLDRKGFSRDNIRRAVTISARHLSRQDYEGLNKIVKQIQLKYLAKMP